VTVVLYLVHDLSDPAVARRVQMLETGGAAVLLAGFCRGDRLPTDLAARSPLLLGRTRDSALIQRTLSVASSLVSSRELRRLADRADVILARNLEMLVLAQRVRAARQRLVYECLDIHRMMLAKSPASAALRLLERRLARKCALLITSSPTFVKHYFSAVQHLATPILIVENKLFPPPREASLQRPPLPLPPYRVAWLGNLRCRRSLTILKTAAALSTNLEILIAGRPSAAEFPRGACEFAGPNVDFRGPYRPTQLAGLYSESDFAWCVDYYEEGMNSEWLLPNRLYEAVAHGSIPIAREDTATAQWVRKRRIGVVVPGAGEIEFLANFFSSLKPAKLKRLRAALAEVPPSSVIADNSDCAALVRVIAG
jgi:hypothetical protein